MNALKILVVGGGIGGLTAAIALRKQGFQVELIEREPKWNVYGVGIIQQSNVVRAMAQLGILDDYLTSGFGFDHVEVYLPNGALAAKVPSPKLAQDYPANVGVSRRALHSVLVARATEAGAAVRLGVTATTMEDTSSCVLVRFSDGGASLYDIVIGADGISSSTRASIFPEAPAPEFVGQSVWRYNFERREDITCLRVYEGPVGAGLVPLATNLMYMFVTTPEPGNPRYPSDGLATAMRSKLNQAPAPTIQALAAQIVDDAGVVYRPLECVFLTGDWHRGRIVLLGDAVHATTPHLGQGAGMAIEDAIVLAEELARTDAPETAFRAYRARRFERCQYIVAASRAICDAQMGIGPHVDQASATRQMFEMTAAPI